MAAVFRRAAKKVSSSTAPEPPPAPTVLGHKTTGMSDRASKQQSGAGHQAQSQDASGRVKDEAPAHLHEPTETSGGGGEAFPREVSLTQP